MATITPNPYSPFADADPGKRHVFAMPAFLIQVPPQPGELLVTGCSRLAVVPDEVQEKTPSAEIPDGVCDLCVAALRSDTILEDARPLSACGDCGGPTRHDGLCALCRRRKHEQWWAALSACGGA